MQEDIDHRAVALVINTTKMTGRALKSAITKYLAHCRQKAKAPPTGWASDLPEREGTCCWWTAIRRGR